MSDDRIPARLRRYRYAIVIAVAVGDQVIAQHNAEGETREPIAYGAAMEAAAAYADGLRLERVYGDDVEILYGVQTIGGWRFAEEST